MSRRCDICGKGPAFGATVSHSGKHGKRVRLPNLQRVRAVLAGKRCRIQACTSCLKAGKVQKV